MASLVSVTAACLLLLIAHRVSSNEVSFTEVANATQRRAVRMDGSPAGYYYASGSRDGAKNWLVYLMGGGWCANIIACQANLTTSCGSTRFATTANFTGILSNHKGINPDFYNWNRIYVVYCDQSSFLGDTEFDGPGPKVQFRGSRIFDAVMEDLMTKGMSSGDNAIPSGRSAGGLATILHCDGFRARLPNVGRVKCLSDAGFFIRALLPATCTERIDPSLCLFPEYLVGDVQTPLFLLNSAFDFYQVESTLVPPLSSDRKRWDICTTNLTTCTIADKELINDFGDAFFKAIREIPYNPSRGLFIDACFSHSVSYDERYWSPNSTVKLGSMTILEAFAKWYFDGDSVTLITPADSLEICI